MAKKKNKKKNNIKITIASVVLALCVSGGILSQGAADSIGELFGIEKVTEIGTEEDIKINETKVNIEAVTDSANNHIVDLSSIPEFTDKPYIEINGNIPGFTDEDYTTEPFEIYSELDSLGRCGVAYANICKELMPTEKRGNISHIYPTGWENKRYDHVDGNALYNRCHLIGFQLAGENDNDKNLITGTRYMNTEGMLPFEDMIDDYVDETGNHVLYRVTPIFEGDNLVASGVQMEGWSVEDNGEGICFNVYAYNCQPRIKIDYATGYNWEIK